MDRQRGNRLSVVGEGRVGASHLQRRDGDHAQAERVFAGKCRLDLCRRFDSQHPAGALDRGIETDRLEHLERRHVHRPGESSAQQHSTGPLALVVEWNVGGSIVVHEQRRRIGYHGGGSKAPRTDRRRVVQRLEGGPRLHLCLGGAVELVAGAELAAADHGEDVTGAGIERNQRALDLSAPRILLAKPVCGGGYGAQVAIVEHHAQHVERRRQLPDETVGALVALADSSHPDFAHVEGQRQQIDDRQKSGVGHRPAPLGTVAAHLVDPLEVAGQGLLRGALIVEIERRPDDQPILIHVHRSEHQLVQPAAYVFAEIGSRVLALQERRGAVGAREVVVVPVLLERQIGLVGGRQPASHHLVENLALQDASAIWMVDRRVAAGTVQLDHQHGGLGERYVAGRMLEVELGRRFDAVGSFAEIDQIEVPLQNLVLGEPALQLNRPPQLDQLAPDGDLGTVGVDRPGKLLGNGRAAGPEASRDHVPGGADRIGYAKPAMLEKVAVLAGEERLYQVRRQLLIADDVSFLVAEELGDDTAVAVEDLGRQRRFVALVHVEAADVAGTRRRHADANSDRNRDQQADGTPYSGNEESPPEKKRSAPPRGDRPTLSGAGTKRSKLGGELNLVTDTLIIDSERRNLRGRANRASTRSSNDPDPQQGPATEYKLASGHSSIGGSCLIWLARTGSGAGPGAGAGEGEEQYRSSQRGRHRRGRQSQQRTPTGECQQRDYRQHGHRQRSRRAARRADGGAAQMTCHARRAASPAQHARGYSRQYAARQPNHHEPVVDNGGAGSEQPQRQCDKRARGRGADHDRHQERRHSQHPQIPERYLRSDSGAYHGRRRAACRISRRRWGA